MQCSIPLVWMEAKRFPNLCTFIAAFEEMNTSGPRNSDDVTHFMGGSSQDGSLADVGIE